MLTTLEYALLGLVGTSPMAGYDVHKLFSSTPLGHFSSSPGAIYPAMRRLERKGLLQAALDRSIETRPRRVYSLTERGAGALEAWLRQPVTREELIRDTGAPILRFVLGEARLAPAEVIAYLEGWRATSEAYVQELRGHLGRMDADRALHPRLALERGIRGYEGDVEWIGEAIAEIRSRLGRGAEAAGEAEHSHGEESR